MRTCKVLEPYRNHVRQADVDAEERRPRIRRGGSDLGQGSSVPWWITSPERDGGVVARDVFEVDPRPWHLGVGQLRVDPGIWATRGNRGGGLGGRTGSVDKGDTTRQETR